MSDNDYYYYLLLLKELFCEHIRTVFLNPKTIIIIIIIIIIIMTANIQAIFSYETIRWTDE
jgi:hypothetical protein